MLHLDEESFVAEVKKRRGRKHALSVAALRSLHDKYTRTITPPAFCSLRPTSSNGS